MAKNNENDKIVFSYTIDSIFDKASRTSAYNCKNISDKQGNNMMSEFVLTVDDKDMFMQGLDSVLTDIYEKILKLTDRESGNALHIEENGEITLTIKDNAAYNENVLAMVDGTLQDCIVNGSLWQWYKSCAHAELADLYAKTFVADLEKLFGRMFQLKIKRTTSMLG